jgi:hypothetical protein
VTRVADGDWVCRSSTTATAINGKGQTIYIVVFLFIWVVVMGKSDEVDVQLDGF